MGAKIEEIFTIEEFLQNKLSEIKWKSLSPSLSLSLSLSLLCVCVCMCVKTILPSFPQNSSHKVAC